LRYGTVFEGTLIDCFGLWEPGNYYYISFSEVKFLPLFLCSISISFLLVSLLPAAQEATLLKGAVYYDSGAALREATAYGMLNDTDSISEMEKIGHISAPTKEEIKIVLVTVTGTLPESPAEFTFPEDPTTYWTLAKNLSLRNPQPAQAEASASPSASAFPSASASPSPADALSARAKSDREILGMPGEEKPPPEPDRTHRKRVRPKTEDKEAEDGSRFGKKIWHTVDGHRRWYYKKYPPQKTKEETVPRATLVQPSATP
jgi:hypothetical protein